MLGGNYLVFLYGSEDTVYYSTSYPGILSSSTLDDQYFSIDDIEGISVDLYPPDDAGRIALKIRYSSDTTPLKIYRAEVITGISIEAGSPVYPDTRPFSSPHDYSSPDSISPFFLNLEDTIILSTGSSITPISVGLSFYDARIIQQDVIKLSTSIEHSTRSVLPNSASSFADVDPMRILTQGVVSQHAEDSNLPGSVYRLSGGGGLAIGGGVSTPETEDFSVLLSKGSEHIVNCENTDDGDYNVEISFFVSVPPNVAMCERKGIQIVRLAIQELVIWVALGYFIVNAIFKKLVSSGSMLVQGQE
ncbi:hypothetical protein ADUPG1_006367 [Aduncisulcus paluster]|uniref:Uncharacterized protein n=1 Tax=Aduncisulcus paluster TaxID=2918883 RepID=A0ABQ5KL02_9EUKA|nr:hypothetical protein ADUPG1_006367 [Aduncisulcus paluster]